MRRTKKLFEPLQGKPEIPPAALVLLNPLPCETEKMNIQYFFHLSLLTFYWFTLFSQQFSDRFPNVDSAGSLIFILWLPLKTRVLAKFGLGLRTPEPQAPCLPETCSVVEFALLYQERREEVPEVRDT